MYNCVCGVCSVVWCGICTCMYIWRPGEYGMASSFFYSSQLCCDGVRVFNWTQSLPFGVGCPVSFQDLPVSTLQPWVYRQLWPYATFMWVLRIPTWLLSYEHWVLLHSTISNQPHKYMYLYTTIKYLIWNKWNLSFETNFEGKLTLSTQHYIMKLIHCSIRFFATLHSKLGNIYISFIIIVQLI